MKKLISVNFILFFCCLSFGATLSSLNKAQIEHLFMNKTAISIPTDNLNGRDINNTFSIFLDAHGNVWGEMSQKPANQPKNDTGTYSIKNDGTVYIKWNHWDEEKMLCFHIFSTQNAIITVDCNNVFHSVFMKNKILKGNHLNNN